MGPGSVGVYDRDDHAAGTDVCKKTGVLRETTGKHRVDDLHGKSFDFVSDVEGMAADLE